MAAESMSMSESAVWSQNETGRPDSCDALLAKFLVEQAGLEASLANQFTLAVNSLGLAVRIGVDTMQTSVIQADTTRADGGQVNASEISNRPAVNGPVVNPVLLITRKVSTAELAAGSSRHRNHSVAGTAQSSDPLERLYGMLAPDRMAVVDWLQRAVVTQSERAGGAWEAEPDGEPTTIHEIAGPLLEPYRVRNGQARLAGCTLDELAHLRIGWVNEVGSFEYRFLSSSGQILKASERDQRGFNELHSVPCRLRASDQAGIRDWVKIGHEGVPAENLIDVTVLWSRRAAGKIVVQFESGRSASITFNGWARDYATAVMHPPMYTCEKTGLESYQIIELQDGSITVAEAVGRCELSGAELFRDSLQICQLTGRLVDQELLGRCAITGRLAIKDLLEGCGWCGRLAVPGVISDGICSRCVGRDSMAVGQPEIRKLLERNPDLGAMLKRGSLSGWAEPELALVVATRLSQQSMHVFRPSDGLLLRRGVRRRPFGKWQITACQ